MNKQAFFEKLKQNPRPVVVDFWAPWCGPCKLVKPTLEKLAGEYAGRVDMWPINADDSQELLAELKIYGIPTLVVYQNGSEVQRQVGAKPAAALKALFESLATGREVAPAGLSAADRSIRLGLGLALAALGWVNHTNWFLILPGAVLMFSAVYDRCPIWRALTSQFKKLTRQA